MRKEITKEGAKLGVNRFAYIFRPDLDKFQLGVGNDNNEGFSVFLSADEMIYMGEKMLADAKQYRENPESFTESWMRRYGMYEQV